MTFYAKAGSFNIDTSKTVGQTQAISGVGFQPTVVLFWWGGSSATSGGVSGGNISPGFGAMKSGTERFGVSSFSLDGSADSDAACTQYSSLCITAFAASSGRDGYMDYSSMDSDGFTIIVDEQFSVAFRVSYLALGGTDLTDVFVGAKTTTGTTGEYDITGIGFQPEAVFISGYASSVDNTSTVNAYFFVGMATASDEQGVLSTYSLDAAATSDTTRYCYNAEIISSRTGAERDAFVNFISDGVRLNHVVGGTARTVYLVCLKGGQYHVGSILSRMDTTEDSETVGFQPSALFLMSHNTDMSSAGAYSSQNRGSIGAASSASVETVQVWSDEDNLADTECATGFYDTGVYAYIADDALVALMNITEMNSTGFKFQMTDADVWTNFILYMALGGEPSGTTLSIDLSPTSGNNRATGLRIYTP